MSQEDLAGLEALEARDTAARRRAVWVSWLSVLAAAAILALLILSASRQLAAVKQQVEIKQKLLNELQSEEKERRQRIADYKKQIANYERIAENYQSIAAEQSIVAQEKIRESDPGPPETTLQIQPRVYLQIVAKKDREYAETIEQSLEQAGFDVLGIEYVPKAAGLKNTEIRYYKKVDEEGARKLLGALQNATGKPVTLVYLGLENNTRVRPRHYEIWFAAGASSPEESP